MAFVYITDGVPDSQFFHSCVWNRYGGRHRDDHLCTFPVFVKLETYSLSGIDCSNL